MDKTLLTDYGIDYERGLRNCMNNPAFYRKILTMFLQDNCFQRAKEAYAQRDYRELFCRTHELKGVSGNAGLTALYETATPLAELLRTGTDAHEQVDLLFAAFEAAYERVCEGAARIIAGS